MVPRRLGSFLFAFVFIFIALSEAIAYTHQDTETASLKLIASAKSTSLSLRKSKLYSPTPFQNYQKITSFGNHRIKVTRLRGGKSDCEDSQRTDQGNNIICAEADIVALGGRKMMAKNVVLEKQMVTKEGKKGETPKISGTSMHLSKKSLGNPEEHLHHHHQKSGLSEAAASAQEPYSFQSDELPGGEEAAAVAAMEKIVSLMDKDYSGAGSTGHNPPINNQQPLHHQPAP